MTAIPQFPGQTGRGIETPKTGEELMGLIGKRDELRGQLESANHQRQMIADQLLSVGTDPAVRGGLVTRLKAVDERIGKLEREIEASDNAIAQAKSNGVSREGTVTIDVPSIPAMPSIPDFPFIYNSTQPTWRDRVLGSLEVTAPITLATVVLLGALMYWRISRSVKNQLARIQATQTGALGELQRSVDSIAVEMERVSENQRFVTKLVGERPVDRTPHSPRTTPH